MGPESILQIRSDEISLRHPFWPNLVIEFTKPGETKFHEIAVKSYPLKFLHK